MFTDASYLCSSGYWEFQANNTDDDGGDDNSDDDNSDDGDDDNSGDDGDDNSGDDGDDNSDDGDDDNSGDDGDDNSGDGDDGNSGDDGDNSGDDDNSGDGDECNSGDGDDANSGDGDDGNSDDGDDGNSDDGDDGNSGEGDDGNSDDGNSDDGDDGNSGDGDDGNSGDGDDGNSGDGDDGNSGDDDDDNSGDGDDGNSGDGDSDDDGGGSSSSLRLHSIMGPIYVCYLYHLSQSFSNWRFGIFVWLILCCFGVGCSAVHCRVFSSILTSPHYPSGPQVCPGGTKSPWFRTSDLIYSSPRARKQLLILLMRQLRPREMKEAAKVTELIIHTEPEGRSQIPTPKNRLRRSLPFMFWQKKRIHQPLAGPPGVRDQVGACWSAWVSIARFIWS